MNILVLEKGLKGILIIDSQKHFQEFVDSNVSFYDSTIIAGQCGRLMARIRNMEVVGDFSAMKSLASPLGIRPSQLRDTIIPKLESNGQVNIRRDNTGMIVKIEETVTTLDKIPELTTEIYERESPEPHEEASLESLEECSKMPLRECELMENLKSKGFSKSDIEMAYGLQCSFGLLGTVIPKTGTQEPIVYSEYIWGKNAERIGNFLSNLEEEDRTTIKMTLEHITKYQGYPLSSPSSDLLTASRKAGLFDVTPVTTARGLKKEFVFTPRLMGTLTHTIDDIYDEVKIFLACIRYGELFSKTSKIRDPIALIGRMIDRKTHTVGPATDIGTNYPLLETSGIVRISRSSAYPDRWNMTLLKPDIAKIALDIVKRGIASSLNYSDKLQSLVFPTHSLSPEQDRIRMGKIGKGAQSANERLLRALRRENL